MMPQPMEPVSRSLSSLLGEGYMSAVCRAASFAGKVPLRPTNPRARSSVMSSVPKAFGEAD